MVLPILLIFCYQLLLVSVSVPSMVFLGIAGSETIDNILFYVSQCIIYGETSALRVRPKVTCLTLDYIGAIVSKDSF